MGRPDVLVVSQLGVETTPGTGVSASKRLLDLMLEFSPELKTQFFRAHGYKYKTAGVRHRQYSIGKFEGAFSFNSIIYILASLFGHSAPSQIGSTGGYTWAIAPSSSAADSFKTFTMQQGDSTAAQQVTNGVFSSLNIEFGEESLSMNGDLIAGPIDNAATLSSSPTEIAEKPVSVSDIDWYIDTTGSGAGTTKWTDVLRASLSIPAKLVPKMVQNTTYQGFRELVEVAVEESKLVIVAENNSQTRAIYDAVNTDSLAFRFIRMKAVGDNIGVSADYTVQGDFACKLEKAQPLRNVQGTYAYEFTFNICHDKTWGKAMVWSIVNMLSAL